jgi:nucleotide-binding universal stress UspA family protein
MKTIIAGTDFTPSSLNACRYAAFMASKLNCKLTLFNLFEAPLMHSNSGLYGITYASQRNTSDKKTQNLINKLKQEFPKVKIDHFVTSGSFRETLEDFISRHLVEAVVMGLGTRDRISKFIYGSHGVNIAAKIDAPVIIIPEAYTNYRLSYVLLAVDNQEKLKKTPLLELDRLARQVKARTTPVHIRTEIEMFDPKTSFVKLSGKSLPIKTIESKDLESGIKKYLKDHKADMIAIISKKHSVFYNLFSESNTKKLAFISKVPVMALHG